MVGGERTEIVEGRVVGDEVDGKKVRRGVNLNFRCWTKILWAAANRGRAPLYEVLIVHFKMPPCPKGLSFSQQNGLCTLGLTQAFVPRRPPS